jgi:adenosylcobinamide-phosphate synthase
MTLFSSMDVMQGLLIPAAFAMDAVVGDPRGLPHPIRWMGRGIEILEPVFRKYIKNEYLSGTLFALSLIVGCWTLTLLVVMGASHIHPTVGVGLEVLFIFFSLSARSLSDAGTEIYLLLRDGRVDTARSKLSMIVGRDVSPYGGGDIARASVETVAENFVDGVLSPLFFAAIGGAPLAMAYKMVNTLDSMIGYKNPRYLRFGRAAARIDDLANFIPARLSVIIISFAARLLTADQGRAALITAIKEGSHHESPNAGYPEAAFAGALGVKLNGPNYYGGVLVDKPYIGVDLGTAKVHHIQKSCELMMFAAIISSFLTWAVSFIMKYRCV